MLLSRTCGDQKMLDFVEWLEWEVDCDQKLISFDSRCHRIWLICSILYSLLPDVGRAETVRRY